MTPEHLPTTSSSFSRSSGDDMPKAKRQITQLLDTFIEREELKQRVNAQES